MGLPSTMLLNTGMPVPILQSECSMHLYVWLESYAQIVLQMKVDAMAS